MLMEALVKLLNRKEFDNISVQEIADEATLNRATFYLHYADKNALLQAMTAARFRSLIARRGLSFTSCDGALRAIVLGMTPNRPGIFPGWRRWKYRLPCLRHFRFFAGLS